MKKVVEKYDAGDLKLKGYMLDGKKERQWVELYPNGEMRSISYYKNGVEDGVFMTFDENGQPLSADIYEQGVKKAYPMAEKALIHAAVKHHGGYRKGTKIPYIVHPVEVTSIVFLVAPENEDAIAAAALHDTVEDTDETVENLRALFGDVVADVVSEESEDKSRTWKERKQTTIDFLNGKLMDDEGKVRVPSEEARLVALADKLSNIRAMMDDLAEEGDTMWNKFNQSDPAVQKWYYQSICDALRCFKETPEWQEFQHHLKSW